MKKTWREKLHKFPEARVVPIPARMVKQYGEGKMVIPTGAEVDAAIRKVRSGRVITTRDLAAQLAEDHDVEAACPMVTGINVRISAEVAAEEEREGKKRVTPYWRVVQSDGSLMKKLPGGPEEQARRLKAEGHRILPGRKPRVEYAVAY
jgi:alkylated DNA nucleotide flippase Atl1